MKFVSLSSAQKFENTPSCIVYEYGGDTSLSGAIAEIHGRYPEDGWAVNDEVKEMVFVLEGTGRVVTKSSEVQLKKDDMALIDKGEAYFFEGNALRIFMPTTPAWTPDQHRVET